MAPKGQIPIVIRRCVVDLDSALALVAAKIGVDAELALADSVVLTARQSDATLWTQTRTWRACPT